MAKTFLCKTEDVAANTLKEFPVDAERKVCVINAEGVLFACEATCPHERFPLCEGFVDGTTLTCLEHLWQWDLTTGDPVGRAEQPLTMFALEIDPESQAVYLKE